jgi:hypothetical protein
MTAPADVGVLRSLVEGGVALRFYQMHRGGYSRAEVTVAAIRKHGNARASREYADRRLKSETDCIL